MSVDFPRAWELTKASDNADHEPGCSWRQSGCLLCDCSFIYQHPEVVEEGVMYGKGGVPSTTVLERPTLSKTETVEEPTP